MQENKMKLKRIQRHTGPKWQRKGVSTGAMLSQAKPTCVSSSAQAKPFAGKVFYLDLPSNRIAEMLEKDIKDLGGTVEKFFSKEIKYLVSNKREARYVHCIRQDPPAPSPDSGPSSPHPPSNRDNIKKARGQTDTFVPSRGKSLVEKVVKEQERVKMNKILSNALEWGVKILYIDDIIAYVKKKKKIVSSQCPAVKTSVKAESAAKQGFQKCKGGRISRPFVKVEDSSRHYRPIYLTMPNMPEFNLKTVPPCSPFCVEDKVLPGNKQPGRRGAKASASEELANGRKKNRDKKRGGYCECCMVKYENITMHLKSERHKAFAKSDEYLVVDKLLSTLHCNFHIQTKVKRPKCSVSSVLVAPGLCGNTVQRLEGDLDEAEIIKEEEQHQTVDGHEGSDSAHSLPIRSVTGSTPLIPRERKSFYTHSDRSKHKSLVSKRSCRRNSLTACSQKAEQAQIPEPRMETAPSRGECFASSPSRVTQVNKVDQTTTQDVNSSNSCFHHMNVQNEASLKCLNVMTHQQEESDKKQNSSVCDVVQEGNILVDKMTGNNLSERQEESLPSHSFSPVRKIQRRVRVYKRKRRKVDTCVESAKPSDIPDNSMLKLWKLFQTTDDLDGDFQGFEN